MKKNFGLQSLLAITVLAMTALFIGAVSSAATGELAKLEQPLTDGGGLNEQPLTDGGV